MQNIELAEEVMKINGIIKTLYNKQNTVSYKKEEKKNS